MDQSQQDAKYVALPPGSATPYRPTRCKCASSRSATARRRPVTSTSATRSSRSTAPRSPTVPRSRSWCRPTVLATDHDQVRPQRHRRTTTITAGKASKDRTSCVPADGSTTGITCVGVTTQDFTTYRFAVDVTINTQLVGGPSAGLAFTLAIIDELTPGSLTGGKRVAITGTIEPDGKVGEVGGVEQKAITAAHQRGAADDRPECGAQGRCAAGRLDIARTAGPAAMVPTAVAVLLWAGIAPWRVIHPNSAWSFLRGNAPTASSGHFRSRTVGPRDRGMADALYLTAQRCARAADRSRRRRGVDASSYVAPQRSVARSSGQHG